MGVDPRVNAGDAVGSDFDADLAAAIDAAALGAGHAVVFNPDAGDLVGRWFLIVDANGVAGYQAGLDYVMEFAGGLAPEQHRGRHVRLSRAARAFALAAVAA